LSQLKEYEPRMRFMMFFWPSTGLRT